MPNLQTPFCSLEQNQVTFPHPYEELLQHGRLIRHLYIFHNLSFHSAVALNPPWLYLDDNYLLVLEVAHL